MIIEGGDGEMGRGWRKGGGGRGEGGGESRDPVNDWPHHIDQNGAKKPNDGSFTPYVITKFICCFGHVSHAQTR